MLYGMRAAPMGQGGYSWPVTARAPIMEVRTGRIGPGEPAIEPVIAQLQTRPPQCPRGQFWDGRRCRGAVAAIPFMPFALMPAAAAGAGAGVSAVTTK